MNLKFQRAVFAILFSLAAGVAAAQTIASKLEFLGDPWAMTVSDLRSFQRNGLLTVQLTVSNTTPSQQTVRYRFKWFDEEGARVWEDEPWKPLLVNGVSLTEIRAVAPLKQAVDFRIEIHTPGSSVLVPAPGPTS